MTPASCNLDSSSKAFKALKKVDETRVKFREFDCDERLKKVRSQRINQSVEISYEMGDPVLFRNDKKKEWKQGTALVRFGKTLYLKYGISLRRVPIDTVIPDSDGAQKVEDGYMEPVENEEEERFKEEDIPVEDLSKDLDAAKENQQLKERILSLEEQTQKGEENNAIDGKVATEKSNDKLVEIEGGDKDTGQQKRKERRR